MHLPLQLFPEHVTAQLRPFSVTLVGRLRVQGSALFDSPGQMSTLTLRLEHMQRRM